MEMEREMEREGDGEGEKWRGSERENVSMAAESGGVFSLLPNLNFNKGGLLVNAVCHDSRRKRIPMRNTTVLFVI